MGERFQGVVKLRSILSGSYLTAGAFSESGNSFQTPDNHDKTEIEMPGIAGHFDDSMFCRISSIS